MTIEEENSDADRRKAFSFESRGKDEPILAEGLCGNLVGIDKGGANENVSMIQLAKQMIQTFWLVLLVIFTTNRNVNANEKGKDY